MTRLTSPVLFLLASFLTNACTVSTGEPTETLEERNEAYSTGPTVLPTLQRTATAIVGDLGNKLDAMETGLQAYANSTDPWVRAFAAKSVLNNKTRVISLCNELLSVSTDPDLKSKTTELRNLLQYQTSSSTEELMYKLLNAIATAKQTLSELTNILKSNRETQDEIIKNLG